ncbi:MAG: hypothetical protein HZA90_18155 [Verrucomicrobia bacterium]|nr:hypothetical protein [Verrucomicrobiota bacterium]
MKRAILPPDFREKLRSLPKELRREIGVAITDLEGGFGEPHRHRGLGIRALRDDYFEIRIGLKLRLVFRNIPQGLVCEMIGDHDDVKRFLKSR